MMQVLSIIAIVVTGLLVGTELSVAAFVHPALEHLPDEVHQPAASALARVLGKVMPVWYPLVFVLILAETLMTWRISGDLSAWFAASTILWLLGSVFSLTSLVPINAKIASWETSGPPADWKTYRNLWDMRHRWRTFVLALSFVFLIAGVVGR